MAERQHGGIYTAYDDDMTLITYDVTVGRGAFKRSYDNLDDAFGAMRSEVEDILHFDGIDQDDIKITLTYRPNDKGECWKGGDE